MGKTQIHTLLRRIIKEIKPSEKEYQTEKKFAEEVIRQIRKKVGGTVKVKLTGSVAKGTYLRESKDIDIFLLLQPKTEKKEFEKIAKKVGFGISKNVEIRYAEHPYVRVTLEGRKIDLVPAYRITNPEKIKSAVDRSVFHTNFVLNKIKKKEIDQVLLLKKFLKANGLYGAEIKVEGFSGYLCEILILKFHTLLNVLKFFSKNNFKKYLFIETQKKSKLFEEPLVFIDPVDRNRNVSAIVSGDNIKRLVKLARTFLKNPSEKYFHRDYELIQKNRIYASKYQKYIIETEKPKCADDIFWGQFKRFSRTIMKKLLAIGFEIKGKYLYTEKNTAFMLIEVEKDKLTGPEIINGPPLELKRNVKKFLSKHKAAKIKRVGGRVIAICKRRITDFVKAVEFLLEDDQIIPSHFLKKKIKIKKLVRGF